MTRIVRFEPEAEQEYIDAARWYEAHREGLGTEFLDAADRALDQIARFPTAGAPVPGLSPHLPVRRAPVTGFPFHIAYLYLEEDRTIRVLAIAHDRRKPGYWSDRS